MKNLLLLGAVAALVSTGAAMAQDLPAPGEWVITITPAPRMVYDDPVPPGAKMSYEQAYQSIPYRLTEYRANPGYRHEAALELMFGQLRPTTVVRPVYGPPAYGPPLQIWNVNGWWRPRYSLFAKSW